LSRAPKGIEESRHLGLELDEFLSISITAMQVI
jgi:predicted hydrolase (HD superfamily)